MAALRLEDKSAKAYCQCHDLFVFLMCSLNYVLFYFNIDIFIIIIIRNMNSQLDEQR